MLKLAKTMVSTAEFSEPDILPETGESGSAHDVVNCSNELGIFHNLTVTLRNRLKLCKPGAVVWRLLA